MRISSCCTAFINRHFDAEVYLHDPVGADHLAGGGQRLQQASWAWSKCLESELIVKGLASRAAYSPCFYMGDGIVAVGMTAEAEALVEPIASMFSICEFGEPEFFVGDEIACDQEAGTIKICQKCECSCACGPDRCRWGAKLLDCGAQGAVTEQGAG
jgi:hypothetical protein